MRASDIRLSYPLRLSLPIGAAVSPAFSADAARVQAFDPASSKVVNAYCVPVNRQRTEAVRGGLHLLLPRAAGCPDSLGSANTLVSSAFLGVTRDFGFGNRFVLGVTPGAGFAQSTNAASDADLAPLGHPAALDDALLGAAARLSSSRDVVVGPNPAGIDKQLFDLTLAGNLGASARLSQLGVGRPPLTATDTYPESTNVHAVTLQVDGSLAGNVKIVNAAQVAGRRAIRGAVGFAPGNGLSAAGGASDSIEPLRVGSALIEDAQVFADAASGVPTRSYGAIVSATDGIAGAFDGTSTKAACLTPSLTCDARSAGLTLIQNDAPLRSVANTPAQFGVATRLDRMIRAADPDAAIMASLVKTLAGDESRSALDSRAAFGRVAVEAAQKLNARSVIQQASARLGIAESRRDGAPPLPGLDRVQAGFESSTYGNTAPGYTQGTLPKVQDPDATGRQASTSVPSEAAVSRSTWRARGPGSMEAAPILRQLPPVTARAFAPIFPERTSLETPCRPT